MANKWEVIGAFKKNPTATSTEIADELDCDGAYVRATLKRAGLRLAGSYRREPSARRGLMALGRAAQRAGLCVADIEQIGKAKRVSA